MWYAQVSDDGFKPFFVEIDEASAGLEDVHSGRYLVIHVAVASSPVLPEPLINLLAVPVGDGRSKKLVKFRFGIAQFIGFRGDCLMCGTRQPEEI